MADVSHPLKYRGWASNKNGLPPESRNERGRRKGLAEIGGGSSSDEAPPGEKAQVKMLRLKIGETDGGSLVFDTEGWRAPLSRVLGELGFCRGDRVVVVLEEDLKSLRWGQQPDET